MNRIIIVGNGFDLAHGLKTKYEDFINWYWDKWGQRLRSCSDKQISDGLCSFILKDEVGLAGWYLVWSYHYSISPFKKYTNRQLVETAISDSTVCDYKMHSAFLERICKSIETKGWVDIEADYYAMLVECKGKKNELERLNKDFAIIQGLLVEYLNNIQEEKIGENLLCDNIKSAMLSPFSKEEIAVSSGKEWGNFVENRLKLKGAELKRILASYVDKQQMRTISTKISNFIKINNDSIIVHGKEPIHWPDYFLVPDRIMLLNFNYTKTADLYMPKNEKFIVNYIHGELANNDSVIFGYGDESDDEYRSIVKQNDNEFLKHIKTNRYLEADKYRQLLSFINSAPFQVCIMGHSCGLSDKTMLKTLFEHDNCVSIKPYYYVNEQGKDNYLDIVQNISRNFTNPQLMRDRVVNKTLCEPMSQLNK